MTRALVPISRAGGKDPEEEKWRVLFRTLMHIRAFRVVGLAALMLIAAAALLLALKVQEREAPEGIVKSNGRIEAERIDIASKYGGRLSEVFVDEGEAVAEGQILARMDTAELKTELLEAEANWRLSLQQLDQANALHAQRQHELSLAKKQYDRVATLRRSGYATDEQVDLRMTAKLSAVTVESAAKAQVAQARSSVDAAAARVARVNTMLEDSSIKAPRQGRIQHRLALPGQVLPASGRVLTALDPGDVHMTVFLPHGEAGRVSINSQARLVFDSAPGVVVPGWVSFVADEAQFTPKYVETKNEREKLMFRVRVKIARNLLEQHAGLVKVGTPGSVYVKLEDDVAWPKWLAPALPSPSSSPAISERRKPKPAPERASSTGVALVQQSNEARKGPRLDHAQIGSRSGVSVVGGRKYTRRQYNAEPHTLLSVSEAANLTK